MRLSDGTYTAYRYLLGSRDGSVLSPSAFTVGLWPALPPARPAGVPLRRLIAVAPYQKSDRPHCPRARPGTLVAMATCGDETGHNCDLAYARDSRYTRSPWYCRVRVYPARGYTRVFGTLKPWCAVGDGRAGQGPLWVRRPSSLREPEQMGGLGVVAAAV